MKKLIWLGASWPQGWELEKIVDSSKVEASVYPKLVAEHFGMECINLAETGGSNEYMLYSLENNKHLVSKNDVIIFDVASKYRFLWIEEDGTPAVTNRLLQRGKSTIYLKIKEYYEKYFANEEYTNWKTTATLNTLYLMALHLGAIPLFVNNYSRTNFNCIIPEKSWLLPQDRCIAEYILGYISDKDLIVVEDMPDLTVAEWKQAKPYIEKYIHPLQNHPNVAGHKKIADGLIAELNNYKEKNNECI